MKENWLLKDLESEDEFFDGIDKNGLGFGGCVFGCAIHTLGQVRLNIGKSGNGLEPAYYFLGFLGQKDLVG